MSTCHSPTPLCYDFHPPRSLKFGSYYYTPTVAHPRLVHSLVHNGLAECIERGVRPSQQQHVTLRPPILSSASQVESNPTCLNPSKSVPLLYAEWRPLATVLAPLPVPTMQPAPHPRWVFRCKRPYPLPYLLPGWDLS